MKIQIPAFLVAAAKKIAPDVYLNLLVSQFEERYSYTKRKRDDDDRRIVNAFRESIGDGKVKDFTHTLYDADYLLSAFEHLTKKAPIEYALVALSDRKDRNSFRYVAVSEGSSDQVAPPLEGIVDELNRRAKAGIKSRLLLVHNHPKHPIKSFLEKGLGMPLGPSTADRKHLLAWAKNPHVQAEFYLYESKEWRRFKVPHFAWLLQMFEKACAGFEVVAQKFDKKRPSGFGAVL